jgi:predicted lipoprotein with Yx(FWY)xxD motif
MILRGKRKLSSTAGFGLSLAAVAAFAAACGGGSNDSGSSSSSEAPSSSASAPAAPGTDASAAGTISSKSGDMGTYLTDGSGKTLYLFAQDTGGKSTCSGDCAAAWPPATTTGTPKAGSGVTASMLSTIKGADGKMQITYAGHPLYYYALDKAAGDTTGQGVDAFGAKWWLEGTDGKQITKMAAPSASDSGSSGSGAGGGWS